MKCKVTILGTRKLNDGTITGTFAFALGTLRRDSVEFEDSPEVYLSTDLGDSGTMELADLLKTKHLTDRFIAQYKTLFTPAGPDMQGDEGKKLPISYKEFHEEEK